MTISNQTCSITYTGNGIQTVFTYNFLIPYQSDGETPAVAVYVIEDDVSTLLTPSEYTITGVDNTLGGTVTYPLSGDELTSAQEIQITRALAYTQPDAFPNQGFYPASVEQLADNLVMMIQQLASQSGLPFVTTPQLECFSFALTDEATVITDTGVYVTWRCPYAGFQLEEVFGSISTAVTTDTFIMDVLNEGVSILDDLIIIEEGEKSSLDAATQPTLTTPFLTKNDEVTIAVTQVGASATGAKVYLLGRQQ